jgi:NTE family protein
VRIDDMAYWDGLFSDNPPIAALAEAQVVGLKNIPNEIWVIKINPTATDMVPAFSKEIGDRRNELAGNVSLFHGLRQLGQINEFLLKGAFTEAFLTKMDVKSPIKIPKALPEDPDRPYHIPMIEMAAEVAKHLTYESKLDRDPAHISRLMHHGEEQGSKFLEARLSYGDVA